MRQDDISNLIAQLGDVNELTRLNASTCLKQLGETAAPHILLGLQEFKDAMYKAAGEVHDEGKTEIYSWAIEECHNILISIGSSAVPFLIAAVDDKKVRREAFSSLKKMSGLTSNHISEFLKNEDPEIRCLTVRTLSSTSAWRSTPIVDIKSLLSDNSIEVKREVVSVLDRLLPTNEVFPIIIELLKDRDSVVRLNALEIVRNNVEIAKRSLNEVIKCFDDRLLYKTAAEVVSTLGAVAAPATKQLIQAMRHESSIYHEKLNDALFAVGKSSIWATVEALDDENENVRTGASHALRDFVYRGPADWKVVETLTERLNTPNWRDQCLAAKALGELGENAKSAVSALAVMSESGASEVQAAAIEAIKKIGGWHGVG